MTTSRRPTKQQITSRELALMIKQKYPGCSVRLLNESAEAYVLIIHDLSKRLTDAVILVYYLNPSIPFAKSFDFYTKNPYFTIPI